MTRQVGFGFQKKYAVQFCTEFGGVSCCLKEADDTGFVPDGGRAQFGFENRLVSIIFQCDRQRAALHQSVFDFAYPFAVGMNSDLDPGHDYAFTCVMAACSASS